MLRVQSNRLHSLLVIMDVALSGVLLMGMLSLPTVSGLNEGGNWTMTGGLLATSLAACLAWPFTIQQMGLYDSQRLRSLDQVIARLVLAGAVSTVIVTAAAFIAKAPVGPRFPVLFGLAQFAVLTFERLAVFGALRIARRVGRNTRNVIVVGTGPRAAGVYHTIQAHPGWGLEIVGFVDDSEQPIDGSIPPEKVQKLIEMPELLRSQVIDEVIVATPRSMLGAVLPVVSACGAAGVPFTLLSDIFGDYLPPPEITRFGSLGALRFASVHHSQAGLSIKRMIDIGIASVGLALSAPVLGVAALAVKMNTPGPAFFRQVRCGVHGRNFEILKLRTMCEGAESQRDALLHLNTMDGPVFKLEEDPRVTRVGRFLRRYSLDELPQLWNVLRGDMSLVGPRPPLPHEVAQYEVFEHRRLSMRPGLTCLWQVSGRNDVRSFDEWVRMDLDYIDTWSLLNDMRILAKTIPAVLRGTGAL
jgi:exopolysaccharide biosynthesis polyprenyl glycosylphosphotransferase